MLRRPIILFALVGVVFVNGCLSSHRGSGSSANLQSAGDAISTFTLVGNTETGRKKWEVQGDTADLMGDVVYLSPVAAKSFGSVDLHLTAKSGRFHKESQDVHLEKDVVVTSSDGARLVTNSLDWKAQREMSSTSDWITVTRPGMTVMGRGGIGFPKLKRVRLEREVTVTLQGNEGQTIVTCEGPMEVDYGRHKARFWRNVWVRDAKGNIRSDRMDVTLDSQTNQIDEASFFGHVQIHNKTQTATAQRAKYWQLPGRTRLIGHTKLVMLPENERAGNER